MTRLNSCVLAAASFTSAIIVATGDSVIMQSPVDNLLMKSSCGSTDDAMCSQLLTNESSNVWTSTVPSSSPSLSKSWRDMFSDENIDYIIDGFWREHQDPVASHMPLIRGGPWTIIGVVLAYLSCVYLWVPLYMRNRPAYSCTKAMKIYNLTNVVLNLIGFLAAFFGTNFSLDVWGCKKKYFPTYLLYLGYGYLLLKFFDFFDTLFFLLRKKQSQVTFLHVTHHCLMPITCYIGLKFVPYGNTGFTPIINSFVHVVMYFYYYLASLGPTVQQILWWKKYITGNTFLKQYLHYLRLMLLLSSWTMSNYFSCIYSFMSFACVYFRLF